jgi:DNA-binding SARP family transcriptional activator
MPSPPVRLPSRPAIAARAAGSAAGLLGVLAGIPWFLVTQVGWPLPRTVPNWERVQAWLVADTVDDMTALKVLACVAWIAWAQFSAAVIVETVAAARHTTAAPIRLLGPAQLLAASLLGTLLMLAATRNTPTGGPAIRPPAVTEAPAQVTPRPPAPRPGPPAHVDSKADRGDADRSRWRVYTVAEGDTLWDIAAAQLGDPYRWPQIYRANAGLPQPDGRILHDPDLILSGWRLRLPDAGAGGARAEQPQPGTPGRPTGPTGPGTPAPTRGDIGDPATVPAGPRTTPTPGAQPPTSGQHARPHAPEPGILLPAGGYAGITIAAAAAAALTLIGLRRRIHRRLDQPATRVPGQPPAPVRVLRRAWLTATRRDDFAADDDGELRPPLPAGLTNPGDGPVPEWPYPPGVLPTGVYPGGEEHLIDIPATGGLGLTGSGAAGLARYLLVAALGAGAPTQHAHHTRVHITRADLTHLLDADLPAEQLPPRLVVADSLDQALGRLEADLLARGRLLAAYDGADVLELRRDHPDEDPLAPVLLVCRAGPSAGRVQAILALGAHRCIGGILLDPWPPGVTWHLGSPQPDDEPNVAGSPPGMRPYTLTADETAALLRLWHTAASATDPFTPPPPPEPPFETKEPAADTLTATDEDPPAPGAAADRPVLLRLFGPPTLLINGTEITTGLRTLGRALLVYLALHRSGATGDAIEDALWSDPTTASPALHPTISRVRALLRQHTGLADAAFITQKNRRYRLDPDLIGVDIWAFTDTLAGAPRGTGPQRAAALEVATGLYTGAFAQDLNYDWAIAPAEDLRLQAATALAELATCYEPTDPERSLAILQRALEVDQYNEQLYQRTMILQARLGQTADIRRTYWQLEQRLYQLDLQPDPETERLRADLISTVHKPTDRRPPAA